MKKYALIFLVSSYVLSFLIGSLTIYLGKGGGIGLVAAMGASFIAAWKFYKDNNRLATKQELHSYTLLSLMYIWLSTIVLTPVILYCIFPVEIAENYLKTALNPVFLAIMLSVGGIFSLLLYLVIRFSFSWYLKRANQDVSK